MKKSFVTAAILLLGSLSASAQEGLDLSRTLRADYIFSGTDKAQEISLSELRSMEGWAGRRVNMDQVPVRGNGEISMSDAASGKILYRQSFSTLFQEWQATEEATKVRKAFENVYLLPMPAVPANITVTLYDINGNVSCKMEHGVNPSDILIRPSVEKAPDYWYVHKSGSPEDCIDVAIVAEGYTAADMDAFRKDAETTVRSFMEQEPFSSMMDRFNFVAVALESNDSGVSVPRQAAWKSTPLGSHFDTFYSERYLTTLHLVKLHDALAGVPYEHIIILANTDTYGGGGIYNSYTLTTTHNKSFKPIVVHEFGHSFAGLADEYYYDDQYSNYYNPQTEPWEQNITTLADFGSKWVHLMPAGSMKKGKPQPAVYTKEQQAATASLRKAAKLDWNNAESAHSVSMGDVSKWPKFQVGVYEGAGYMSKGVYRPFPECRMKINEYPEFCPVCQDAITRMIDFYTVAAPSK